MAEYTLQPSPHQAAQSVRGNTIRGQWTPEISCNIPGDLSVTYGVQRGFYIRTTEVVDVWFQVDTGSFTHSTASGFWRLINLPYTAQSFASGAVNFMGSVVVGGVTVSSMNLIQPVIQTATIFIVFYYSNLAGAAVNALAVSHIPSGALPQFYGHVRYSAES